MQIGIIIEKNGIIQFAIIILKMQQSLVAKCLIRITSTVDYAISVSFFAMQNTNVFDYVIWVDRSMHLPPEDKNSMSLEQWMADYTIDNNGDLLELQFNVRSLMNNLN